MGKEKIINLPNLITSFRGIGTALIVYLIFADYSKLTILVVFILLALTDGIDGWIARKFNQKTKFGKNLDPVMDRIFMIIVVASAVIRFGIIDHELVFKLLPFMLTREIIAAPFYILVRKFDIRINVKPVGKVTTGFQSVTVPVVLLSLPYAIILIAITSAIGIMSGITYAIDSYKPIKKS